MGLPPFFSRVADSLRPVTDVAPEILEGKLADIVIELHVPVDRPDRGMREAALLATNLLSRLYPSLELHTYGDHDLNAVLADVAVSINPEIELRAIAPTEPSATVEETISRVALVLGSPAHFEPAANDAPTNKPAAAAACSSTDVHCVHIDASHWTAADDREAAEHEPGRLVEPAPGHPLAWLAAAALGVGEVFRVVFADELGPRGRRGPQPGSMDLLRGQTVDQQTGEADRSKAPASASIDIGDVHLAGAGAIGQAFLLALRVAGVSGHLTVVDPETITLSNLQRYVLSDASSVGLPKGDLAKDYLQRSGSGLTVDVDPVRWGDRTTHIKAGTVAVALDSARDRIAVASTLPRNAYNAWTQVADLGWSRHEEFGAQPCLACLYYPTITRPSDHELIAAALGDC